MLCLRASQGEKCSETGYSCSAQEGKFGRACKPDCSDGGSWIATKHSQSSHLLLLRINLTIVFESRPILSSATRTTVLRLTRDGSHVAIENCRENFGPLTRFPQSEYSVEIFEPRDKYFRNGLKSLDHPEICGPPHLCLHSRFSRHNTFHFHHQHNACMEIGTS